MEIELKYNIPDTETADKIWQNELFADQEESESRDEFCLDARYYDTDNFDLSDRQIAYRVRKEGSRWVAALKWSGTSEGALHERQELNVPVFDSEPDISIFSQSELGEELAQATAGRSLSCIVKSQIHRKIYRLDTETGLFEVSVDSGKVITPKGEVPICELEIELFSGETEELLEIGTQFEEAYGLTPSNASKYARGLYLLRGEV